MLYLSLFTNTNVLFAVNISTLSFSNHIHVRRAKNGGKGNECVIRNTVDAHVRVKHAAEKSIRYAAHLYGALQIFTFRFPPFSTYACFAFINQVPQ